MAADITKQLHAQLDQDLHALFRAAGRDAIGFGAAEPNDADAEAAGRRWFEAVRPALQKRICNSRTYQLYRNEPSRWDRAYLLAAVSDAITGFTTGVAPVTAATILLKIGLESLCTAVPPADDVKKA